MELKKSTITVLPLHKLSGTWSYKESSTAGEKKLLLPLYFGQAKHHLL